MKKITLFLFFFTSTAIAQPITMTIDSIAKMDSSLERRFTIYFTIANTSPNDVSFFLDPTFFIPAHSGQLTSAVLYKIFQENDLIEASGILGFRDQNKDNLTPYQLYKRDSLQEALRETDLNKRKLQMQQHFVQTKMTLQSGERKSYSKVLYWDFERYHKQGDNEFYLDADKNYYFQLMMICYRDEYRTKLSPPEFEKMMADPSFIKGWFMSNKAKIDYSPI